MRIIKEDALEGLMTLPDKCCDTCITSPPYYGLRDYDAPGQIGLEPNPKEYIEKLVNVFREVRRVLKDDGTLWIVIGDSYATSSGNQPPANTRNSCGHTAKKRPDGYKLKDLMGIPWMLALALREDGWYLRQDIIWHKPNCMPESVRDRCTKSHEYIFLLSKKPKYYFDAEAISEPITGSSPYIPSMKKNKRDVWSIATEGFKGPHFAVFPRKLVKNCILAGSRPGGTVLDPFMGSGTTGVVATETGRDFIGIDINPEYCKLSYYRITEEKRRKP